MKLDISHFKKVHEDHNSATLRHEDGHEIKVSKSSLSPAMKAKLARLPAHLVDGGQVYDPNADIMERMNQPATSRPTKDWGEYFTAMKQIQDAKDAERLGVPPQAQPEMQKEANRAPAGIGSDIGNALRSSIGDALGAAGTVLKPVYNEVRDFGQSLAGVTPANAAEPDPGLAGRAAPSASAVEKGGPSFGNASLMGGAMRAPSASGIELQGKQVAPTGAPGSNIAADFNQVARGARNEANALGAEGRAEAMAADRVTKSLDDLMADHQKRYAALNDEVNNTVKDIQNSKIKADNYMESKSTGSKVATAIGLILGGMGGGLLRQENPALKFLNNNIDRDIDAQKQNLDKKNTVLSAYLHQTKDLTEATAMTKAFYLEKYSNDIRKAAALSKDPMAQARADQTIGKLNFEKHQILNGIAEKQTKMDFVRNSGGNLDPAQLVQHTVPEKHQAQVFKEIGAAQNTKRMAKEILHHFDEGAKENTVLKTGGGLLRTPPSVLAFHQSLGPTFADLEGSVAQGTIQNVKENMTPRPGDLDSTIKTKRAALIGYLQSKAAAPTAKGYGIDLSRFESTAPYAETKIDAPEGYKGKHGK